MFLVWLVKQMLQSQLIVPRLRRQRDVELLFLQAALGPAAKAVFVVLWQLVEPPALTFRCAVAVGGTPCTYLLLCCGSRWNPLYLTFAVLWQLVEPPVLTCLCIYISTVYLCLLNSV